MAIRNAGHADGIVGDAAGTASLSRVPEFLTVRELAQILRIGRNQAYALVNTGQITAWRFGASIRVPRAAVQRLLDAASVLAVPGEGAGGMGNPTEGPVSHA